jgi:hypothetical protein
MRGEYATQEEAARAVLASLGGVVREKTHIVWRTHTWRPMHATAMKSRNLVADYFAVLVNYGGEIMPRGRMIAIMQEEGIPQRGIDIYVAGQASRMERDEAQRLAESTAECA